MKEHVVKIMGIDPGNNLGVSIISVDIRDLSILDIEVKTYVLEDYVSYITGDKVMNKLFYIQDLIPKLCYEYQPIVISMETAFMNSRFPKAVINLSQYVGMIEYTIRSTNPFIKIFKYAPKYIKSKISTGDANKNDMKSGIASIPEIYDKLDMKFTTEHSIDATAMAYVALKEIRECPIVLCSIPN